MKILFYDIKNQELERFIEKMPSNIEPYFFKTTLNNTTYIDKKYLNSEALSVFVGSELNKETLSKFKNLKFIFLRSVGFSNVDTEYCKEKEIHIFNAPNYGNSTVAEYTFALLLALSKKIISANKSIINGDTDMELLQGIELYKKTIGVIGAGKIGRKVINIAHGFGMNVLVYDLEKIGAYEYVEFEELLKNSDIISINCPLNNSSRKLIDKYSLSKMKRNTIIINTARGEIIDTEALYYALIDKKIKGAALDVIECEQYLCHNWKKCSDNEIFKSVCLKKYFFIEKLLKLNNVIITPHNAYNTIEAQKRIIDITLQNIETTFNFSYSAKNLVLI